MTALPPFFWGSAKRPPAYHSSIVPEMCEEADSLTLGMYSALYCCLCEGRRVVRQTDPLVVGTQWSWALPCHRLPGISGALNSKPIAFQAIKVCPDPRIPIPIPTKCRKRNKDSKNDRSNGHGVLCGQESAQMGAMVEVWQNRGGSTKTKERVCHTFALCADD